MFQELIRTKKMSHKLPEEQKKKYTPLNLPSDLVEDIKAYRIACISCSGQNITYEQLIREMMYEYLRVRRNRRGDRFVFVLNEIKNK